MHKNLLKYVLLILAFRSFSQCDSLTLLNGRVLPLKVLKITDSVVVFERTDIPDHTKHELSIDLISRIKFANNTQVLLNKPSISTPVELKKQEHFKKCIGFNLTGYSRSEYIFDYEHHIKNMFTLGGCFGVTYGKDYYNQLLQYLVKYSETRLFNEDKNEFILGSDKFSPGFAVGLSPKIYLKNDVFKGSYVGLIFKSSLRKYIYDSGYLLNDFKYISYDSGSGVVSYYGLPMFTEKQTGKITNTSLSFIMGCMNGGNSTVYNNLSFELGYNLLSFNKPIYTANSGGRAIVSLSKSMVRELNLYFFINYSIGIRY